MEEFEFDRATFGAGGQASFGNDNALHFVWKMDAVEVTSKTEMEGRKIFMDVECCEIHFPGFKNIIYKQFKSPDTNPKEKLKLAEFFRQHPKARALYREWKDGVTSSNIGTPISEWGTLSEAERAELRAANIFTIEQMMEASDVVCQSLGPKGREYRTKAAATIETSKESAAAQRYAAENQRLREDVELLRQQIAQIGMPKVEAPRKRGRPRKDESANSGEIFINEDNS